MGVESKNSILLSSLVIILSCLMTLILLNYANYNLSVFKQIFAYNFYQTTEASKVKSGIGCIAINMGKRVPTFFDRNESVFLGGGLGKNSFEYEVKGKKYSSSGYSYTRNYMRCDETISQATYFPLIPQWSIVNNALPEGEIWNNFVKSTKTISIYILIYSILVLSVFVFDKKVQKVKYNKRFFLIVLSLFLPFLIIHFLFICNVFNILENSFKRLNNDYREILLVLASILLVFSPSAVVFKELFKNVKLGNVYVFLLTIVFTSIMCWFVLMISTKLPSHSILIF